MTLAELEAGLRGGAFAPSAAPRRIGAEVELIPVDASTGRVCPIEAGAGAADEVADDAPPATLPLLRRAGAGRGWCEVRSAKGIPSFRLPDGGTITFEPGGQLEYGSPPCRSLSALLIRLRDVVDPLRAAADDAGVALLGVGIDPRTPVECAPLRLRAPRYCRMADYFATIGAAGARMMRQTASLQVSLDPEEQPALRWRVLNAAAPYVVAIFANSRRYAGAETGHASYRAHVWRTLDPSRTGLAGWSGTPEGADPVRAYLDFALDAPAMMLGAPEGEYRPMRDWLAGGGATRDDWDVHLTTLFPEVRPRGWLEVRSCDAVPPEWWAAPLALLAGLTYHAPSLAAAADVLGAPDPELLCRAGRLALRDPGIAATARDLWAIALAGCESLGADFVAPADLDVAREFAAAYTARGRTPGDG